MDLGVVAGGLSKGGYNLIPLSHRSSPLSQPLRSRKCWKVIGEGQDSWGARPVGQVGGSKVGEVSES